MPRCFPDEPDFPDDRLAERVVWEHLRDQLPDDAALFHSVNLLERDREHEIDLLVAWPGVGLAAVEVKGGHVRRDAQGWTQESGGHKRKIGSPVVQAQDGRHVLQRYLQKQTSSAGGTRSMHLVAFPFTAVPAGWEAPDIDRSCVVAKGELTDIAARVRRGVEQHGEGHRPLTDVDCDAVIRVLAAELGSQTSLLSDAEEHEKRVDQMTRDQAKVLASFKYHRRLKVIGGAGTGKTWLALEQARRLAKAGERVALVCYSRGLARWFERSTEAWPVKERPAYVGLFHQLPVEWGARPGVDDSADFEERLPRELGELAAQRPKADLFDSVVVDEAQDFGALWWPSLVACLRDQDGGGLYVFMDEAQRVFAREGDAPIDLPPYVLDENIRNTKNIANLFSSLSGEQLRPRGLAGPPVRFVECGDENVVARADDAVCALLDEGFEPGQIALLTTQHRHPEQKSSVELGGWAPYWDAFFAADDVFYGHVLGFKGLERSAVVLAVNGFRDLERAREMLYVGLSRARSLLVVVGRRSVLEEVGGGGVRKRLGKAETWDPPAT
jgi:hypothetical protein